MRHSSRWYAGVAGLSVLVVTLAATLVATGAAVAQDWPQWRGPNRDGKASGFTAPEKWPSALTQKWTVKVGTGDATPALVGDKLYVFARQGADEVTLCLSAADGKELWRDKYAAQEVKGAASSHPGPRGSPAVAEGKVATLGVGGVLSCLDAETGKVVWRKDEYTKAVPQFFTGLSPIIVDGACIAHLGGKGEGAIIAFDLATGKEKWKWAGEGPTYDSPVLMTVDGTKQVVVFTEKSLVGLAVADGKLLWQVAAQPEGRNYNCATPVIDGQTVICTGQGRGTKAVKVEKQGDAFVAKDVWSNDQVGTGFNTPVLKGDLLFGLSAAGNLFCLDAKTGKTAWLDDKTKRDRFGSVVEAGPAVVALLGNSELVAFKAGGAGYEELAKIKVSEAPTYAHPVLAGNRIFIKDRDAVTLWTLP